MGEFGLSRLFQALFVIVDFSLVFFPFLNLSGDPILLMVPSNALVTWTGDPAVQALTRQGAWVYLYQLDELFRLHKKINIFAMHPDHEVILRQALKEK